MNGSTQAPGTPYEALGSEAAVRELVESFYGYMDTLPECQVIRAMHKGDLEPMIDKLATFLTGWMGGPQRYREKFGRVVIPAVHEPFAIGESERDQWLLCMERALADTELNENWRQRLMEGFGAMAEMCRTR